MANHVAVRVVADDDVVLAALDGADQLVGQLFGAHLRLQVIGGHFRAGDDLAVFTGEAIFFATVEEEGDVSVLLGLGDAQLGLALLGQPLAQGVDQGGGRVGAGGLDVGRVLGQHHEVQGRGGGTGEAGEVAVDEGAGDLAGTVGTEVHEDQRIAIFHRGGVADAGGLDELVVLFTGIGGSQGVGGVVGGELALALGHQVIGLLHAIPAVVTVHGEVTADHGGETTLAQAGEQSVELMEDWAERGGTSRPSRKAWK